MSNEIGQITTAKEGTFDLYEDDIGIFLTTNGTWVPKYIKDTFLSDPMFTTPYIKKIYPESKIDVVFIDSLKYQGLKNFSKSFPELSLILFLKKYKHLIEIHHRHETIFQPI